MDKLRGMETFIAVVECGSFTGRRSRLGLSAVMVGKYIAQLESQLATRLERNTRRQSLTDAGRVYFDEAKRVMEQVSIAESAVERLRLAPAGTCGERSHLVRRQRDRAPDRHLPAGLACGRVELDLTNRMVDLVDEGVRSGDPYRRDPSGGSGGSLPGAVSDGDLRRAGLSGALRDPQDARGSRRSSLPVPYGLDRPQRVAAAGRRGRSALETRCGFALQRWLRAAPGGDRRGRAADAAGGAAADALASGSLVRVLEAWTPQPRPASALAPGSSAPAEADAVYRPPSAGNGRRADNDPRVGIITPPAAPAASRQSDRWDLRSPPTNGSAAV